MVQCRFYADIINHFYNTSIAVDFVHRLQGNGLCDRRQRPCRKVTVMGTGFVNSTNMTCHITKFKVHNYIKNCHILFLTIFPARQKYISLGQYIKIFAINIT